MAIGDAIAAIMGTGTVTRQPSAGVEEQISAIVKDATTDYIVMTDGSNELSIFGADVETDSVHGAASATYQNGYNMALMITNSVYLKKTGTTNTMYVCGVQTNA